MAYELHHKNNTISPILEAGRYRYSFSPETPYEELKFIHDGQIGDWHFDQVMLNQGQFEQYEENTNTESMLGTAFSHIEKLQSFVTNEDGELTRSVEEGMDYTLKKYIDIIEGTSSETLDTAHGVYRTIQNSLTKETSRFILDDSNFLVNLNKALTDEDGNIREQMGVIHATYDNLSLGLFGQEGMISGIGVVEEGVRVKGDIIRLEGTTVMDDAFIQQLTAKEIFTTNIVALTGTYGDLIANNLDVNNLTGNKASFLDALFESKDSTLAIDGDKVDITTQVGFQTRFLRLNWHGLELRKGETKMGHLGSGESSSIFLGANNGHEITLGYQGTNSISSNKYNTAIKVDGTTGLITLDRDLRTPERILNTSGRGFAIGNISSGFSLQGTNNAQVVYYNNGDIGISMSNGQVLLASTINNNFQTISSTASTASTNATNALNRANANFNTLNDHAGHINELYRRVNALS